MTYCYGRRVQNYVKLTYLSGSIKANDQICSLLVVIRSLCPVFTELIYIDSMMRKLINYNVGKIALKQEHFHAIGSWYQWRYGNRMPNVSEALC